MNHSTQTNSIIIQKTMPPFSTVKSQSRSLKSKSLDTQIVTLNVGGKRFQTTRETLTLAGSNSILSEPPSFIDRDPSIFSLLLSYLRTNRLPSSSTYSLPDIIAEAEFYGIDSSLFLNTASFEPLDLRRSDLLPLNGRDFPSAISADESGAIHVAHGGKITSFDRSLTKKSTLLTSFPTIDSLLAIDRNFVAAGAVDIPGLQILNIGKANIEKTLHFNTIGSGSVVQALGLSPDYLFGSFESIRRNSSAIMAFDRTTFKEVMEIGKKDVYGAELDTAIPATKLKWVDGYNLLMASGSHAGPSGLTGNVRLWDVRSGKAVYEFTENVDCFADVDVSVRLSGVFKVGVNSGDMFMKDLRMLDHISSSGEAWTCVGKKGAVGGKNVNGREGLGCLVECYGDKVFVSRGGDVEIWSEIVMGSGVRKNEDGVNGGEGVMRRNVLGRREDLGKKKIVKLGFGGSRMVLLRKEAHCVELWGSSSAR